MKTVCQIYLGFSDAQNYAQKKNKVAFNDIFVRNAYLDQLLDPNVYFLIGEKGTGKTAFATYLSNNNYHETKASISYLAATDYEKFYALKKKKDLDLTGYVGIWKVILLLLLAKGVSAKDQIVSIYKRNSLSELNKAVDEYYMNAFSPEITTVMKVVDDSEIFAKIVSRYAEIGGSNGTKIEFTETRFQQNLYYIEKSFADAIKNLKLNKDIILFIDGIDIRPDEISYPEYIECIKGLANAVWNLNTGLFSNVKDTKGQFKVVLLLRPDIFNSLNLQNATNKLFDNSVFLEWRTTYQEYTNSSLYEVAKKLLSYQQQDYVGDIFEKYFQWKIASTNKERKYDTAFMEFLKISLSRPRDILVIMQLIQKKMNKDGLGDSQFFAKEAFDSNEFQNGYSDYFMSSLKDQLSFYYSNIEFEIFLKFFDYFKYADFTYDEYMENYNKFIDYVCENADEIPKFVDDAQNLLQLLYDCNIIAAIEREENGNMFFHFSYREKDSAHISPKVWKGDNVSYRFHYGLYKKTKKGRY